MDNPADPYGGEGRSPLRASWESVLLESKVMATTGAIMDNEGMPRSIVSPNEGIGEDEAGRWEHRFNAKFRQAGAGGTMFSEEPLTVHPLTFPPKDLAVLTIANATKGDVCGTFGVPVALLESNTFNRATLDASILQHVRQAIWPRLRQMEAILNKHIAPLYGDNLFFAFDDPSPESEELKAKYLRTLVDGGIFDRNEARLEFDKPPKEGGDILTGLPGASEFGGSAENAPESPQSDEESTPEAEPVETTSDADVTPELATEDQEASELLGRVGGITGMMDMVAQRNEGVITDDTLVELLILFYRLERSQAESLVATLPEEKEEDETPDNTDKFPIATPDGGTVGSMSEFMGVIGGES